MSKDKLIIFDTTLRDGEQSPGASMTRDEKIRIARALELMKVDIIEAGFPIASDGDFESVKAVAEIIKDSTVCGLARAKRIDIERAGEAIKAANSGRIHTFLATSPIHIMTSRHRTRRPCAKMSSRALPRISAVPPRTRPSWRARLRSRPWWPCAISRSGSAAGISS